MAKAWKRRKKYKPNQEREENRSEKLQFNLTKFAKREPYTFKVTNKGSLSAKYKVKILDDEKMIVEDGCVDNLLPKNKIKYSLNGGEPQLLSKGVYSR